MITRRSALALATAAASTALSARHTHAQAQYPDHPVRLIIPFAPGGVYDAVGRPLAERLKATLGATVVENVVGAGGSRGAGLVVHAKPDGYTLLIGGTSEQVILPLASSQPPYDPATDFAPVGRIGVSGLAFVANPSVPVRDLRELITYVKANPGKLSFGTPGAGTLHHLTGEMFNLLVAPKGIVHVPYAGAGPALNDLLGGHIEIAIVIISAQVLEFHRSGKLKMLAMTTPQRIPAAPEVATAAESGLPTLVSQFFIGLLAPKDTPDDIMGKLREATNAALADRELRALFEAASFDAERTADPALMRQFLKSEIERWAPVVKATGFKIN